MANFSIQSSAWILAIITIDRYLIVTNTKWKQKFSKNIKFNLTVIISVITFFVFINLPPTFLNGQIGLSKSSNSTFNKTRIECYNSKYYKIWQNITVLIECLAPLTLMISFNGLLIMKTYESSVKLDVMHKNRESSTIQLETTNPIQVTYSSTDLSNDRSSHSNNKHLENTFSFYFDPIVSLNRSKSKNLFQHYCSLSVLPPMNDNLPNGKYSKNRRFSDAFHDNLSINNFNKKETNNKFLTANTKNLRTSHNNLAITSDLNLSRSCISLADRPTSNTRNRKIVLMLTLLTLSFTISTLPSSIFYAFFRPIFSDKPYRRLLTMSFNLLRHLSHAFNFIIYFTSSSIIKQQLKETIRDLNRKRFIRYVKDKFSCFLFIQPGKNDKNKTNGHLNFKTKTDTPLGDDPEDTSIFLNSKSSKMQDNLKKDENKSINNIDELDKFEVKITKITRSESTSLLKDGTKNQVEFESISFFVPSVPNSKKKTNKN